MRAAKIFAYVAVGILALATAAHLQIEKVEAQSHGTLVDIEWRLADGRAYAVDSEGNIYSGPGYCGALTWVAKLPEGCIPAGILGGDVGGSMDVFCTNGDAYTLTGTYPNISYHWCANVFGEQPTQATETTWGRIKADRR